MKAKRLLLTFAALLLISLGTYNFFFGGPYRFVDRNIEEQSLQHLHLNPAGTSPSEIAFEYLYWWPGIDRPDRAKLEITTSYHPTGVAVVTIFDHDGQSDSTYSTCDRLTLRRQNGAWIPIRHQAAWQGRGRIGWTTQPTL